jgi:type I restriction-modification system DNA methylase subunit
MTNREVRRLRRAQSGEVQDRLASLRFFDPACGCGNFLIIAYRELRQIELELLQEIRSKSEGSIQMFDVATMSKIDVNQFYGIEISEFPARIAETALWMMDHIMNRTPNRSRDSRRSSREGRAPRSLRQ